MIWITRTSAFSLRSDSYCCQTIYGKDGLCSESGPVYVCAQSCADSNFQLGNVRRISWSIRILSMESKVDSQSMRTGTLQPADWEKLIESAGVISTAPLIIDDTPGISITELRSKCRKYKLENDLAWSLLTTCS